MTTKRIYHDDHKCYQDEVTFIVQWTGDNAIYFTRFWNKNMAVSYPHPKFIFKVTPTSEPLSVRLARRFKVTSAKVVKEGDKTFGRFELEIMPKQDHILHLQNHIS